MNNPTFYDDTRVGTLYRPDVNAAINAANQADVPPASEDTARTALLLVDAQVDFVHEDGALSVPGAVDDARRTIRWIFDHLGAITTIYASLDSHMPIQVFSPSWWVNQEGQHPEPFTSIPAATVHDGTWRPLYDEAWSREYVVRLEENAKKQLMIWPYHTLIGTPGHSITPALYEVIAYHGAARKTQPHYITKGTIPKTEHYSLFEPEVKTDDLPNGGLNRALLDEIGDFDRVYIAGQAKSHCVLESVTSLMRYYEDQPEVIAKLFLLEDTTSSVADPNIDFEALARQTFAKFQDQGLHIVQTDS